jgi:cellulose synthase/poly-beta-1,6-N-acetylglucosamine synthase-like glycosyltransferase
MTGAAIVFWAAAAFVAYTYAGYPLLLWLLTRVWRRPVRRGRYEPSVSLLVAAYNEADVIAEKLQNSLALDYPADRLEIVVASDGSTDGTVDIVRSVMDGSDGRIRLLPFERNRGKVQALNDAVPLLRGEIVAFSDASSLLAPEALRELVANFADRSVGAASGVYEVAADARASLARQEDLYWKYETFLKTQEARLGTLTGAHGSLYAIRRDLYPFPPAGTINDDFVIPTSVIARGYRIAYETQAVAREPAAEMEGFGRRVRIAAGNVAQLREVGSWLSPLRPLVLACFLSHKAARLAVPIALAAMVISNLFLLDDPFYAVLFAGQVLFYGLAILGALGLRRPKLLRLPYYFCMINSALFVWLYYRLTRPAQATAWGAART